MVSSMRSRNKRYQLFGALLFVGALSTANAFELSLNNEQQLSLGETTLGVPRFGLQEWLPKESAAQPVAQQPTEAIVGSAVAAQALDSIMLQPKNDPWFATQSAITQSATSTAFTQTATFHEGLSVTAEWTVETENQVRIKGYLNNSSTAENRREVPLTLMLEIPVSTTKNQWLYSPTEVIETDSVTDLCWTFPTTAGSSGSMSRLPFGGLLQGNNGFAVSIPLDQPRIHRIEWNAKRNSMILSLEVAVSDLPSKFPNQVPFEFVLYKFNASGGFREMLQRYYDQNPEAFFDRTDVQGNWMPFTQVDHVARPEDFAFSYHEYHPNVSVAYNNANNIESLVYCEPVVKYINISPSLPQTSDTLQQALKGADPIKSAVRGSGAFNEQGELMHSWVVTPWAVGARVPTNSDVQVPRTAENPENAFDYSWNPYIDLYRNRALNAPAEWGDQALLTDGIVGATGRVAWLKSGTSISQEVGNKGGETELLLTLSGSEGSSVTVRAGERETTLNPVAEFKTYSVKGRFEASGKLEISCTNGDVFLQEVASTDVAIQNGDFAVGSKDAEQVTGLYLDSFEGWDSKDFDFRREYFQYADYPLTFDARTGRVGQVIMFQNFEFAAEARKRLDRRGDLLMANTALYQWSWSAAWLDVMGIETNWGSGTELNPPPIEELSYIRAMSAQKPYCYLQNLDFKQFRGEKVEGYFRYCLHFGFWPSFFSYNAADDPYWEDPELYNADRYLFLRYMEPQRLMTRAGWEPVTLASVDHEEVLLERWGGGVFRNDPLTVDEVFFTLLNPSELDYSLMLTLDNRLVDSTAEYAYFDLITGDRLFAGSMGNTLPLDLPADQVLAIQALKQEASALEQVIKRQRDSILVLGEKWKRHGMLSSNQLQQLEQDFADPAPRSFSVACENWSTQTAELLEPIYQEEAERAFSLLRQYASLLEEQQLGTTLQPVLPKYLVEGEVVELNAGSFSSDSDYLVQLNEESPLLLASDQVVSFALPKGTSVGDTVRLTIRAKDPSASAFYFTRSLKVRPSAEIFSLPEKLVMRENATRTILFRNNKPGNQTAELKVTDPAKLINATLQETKGASDDLQPFRLNLQLNGGLQRNDQSAILTLAFEENGVATKSWQLPVTILSDASSLLRSEVNEVIVDASYFGYNTRPLIDGVTDTQGVDWVNAAWASEESLSAHWAEFRFREEQPISSVTVWWALEGKDYQTSSAVEIQVRETPSSEWKTVAIHQDSTPTAFSEFTFPLQSVSSLRIYQLPGGGPPSRPGILWLGEVEAR